MAQLVPVVCAVLQQSTYQLPAPHKTTPPEGANADVDVKLKVHFSSCIFFNLLIYFLLLLNVFILIFTVSI